MVFTIAARWVFPVDRPPLPEGTVTIAGERIVAVEPKGTRRPDRDFGDAALIPGLVNAHTHLDLTGLRGLLPPGKNFLDWLRGVVAARIRLSADAVIQGVVDGLAECLRTGTTLIGDISSLGLSWELLRNAPCRSVVYYELLGLSRTRAKASWQSFANWFGERTSTQTCRLGLSPHAPYSVRRSLFRLAAWHARRHGLPVATHLAEFKEELELLSERRGPFVEFLQQLGVWDDAGLIDGPGDWSRINRAVPAAALVHGNYLPASWRPSGNQLPVLCPRTHAAFGHPRHPLLAAGIGPCSLALGTDSLASNPDLDLWNEVLFLQETQPQLAPAELLRMATLYGARALDWADDTGSLTAGKSADVLVRSLPRGEAPDPHELLLDPRGMLKAAMCRGRWLFDLHASGAVVPFSGP